MQKSANERTKRRFSPIVLLFLLLLLAAALAGYQFWLKPLWQEQQLRDAVETMMQAYEHRDLPTALSCTDLKDYSDHIEDYVLERMKGWGMLGNGMEKLLPESESYSEPIENMILNCIRDWEIEEVRMEKDKGFVSVNLTVPDLENTDEGMGAGYMVADTFANALAEVDISSKIGSVLEDPSLQNIWDALTGVAGEGKDGIIEGAVNSALNSMNATMTEADSTSVSLEIPAHWDGETWVIELDGLISRSVWEDTSA